MLIVVRTNFKYCLTKKENQAHIPASADKQQSPKHSYTNIMCFRLLDCFLPLLQNRTREQAFENSFDDDDDDSSFLAWDDESDEARLIRRRRGSDAQMYAMIDPLYDPENPDKILTPLEFIVYTSQWQKFWKFFLMDSWDKAVHPVPPKHCFSILYTLLDPYNQEMMATLYLADLVAKPRETMNLQDIQECLAILDPLFDWKEQVELPLQYKRAFLENMGLPEDIQAMIWREHVERDVVNQAVICCARGVVALDDELSQKALRSRF